jgi:hypothetical protein
MAVVSELAVSPRVGRLPSGWQLYCLILVYPVLWWLGFVYFVWPALALVFVAALCVRAPVRVPPGFGLWMLFLAWMLCSVIEVSTGLRYGLFAWRAVIYLSATAVFLWVYNSSEEDLPADTVANALTVFWALAVVGGGLGVVFPRFSTHSLAEHLLPPSVLSNVTAYAYVHPALAEIQSHALGRAIGRPMALFAYTNQWAAMVGVLTPFAVITAIRARRPLIRTAVVSLLVFSAVPILISLNRGLWIALAVAFAYVVLRMPSTGHHRLAVGLIAACSVVAVLAVASPLGRVVSARVASNADNNVRAVLYQQAISGVRSSPLFGYGSPRPSTAAITGNAHVGTQGQFWLILFSHGLPGLAFYLGWFVFTAVHAARRRSLHEILWQAVLIVSFVEMMVYDFLPAPLYVVMIACALLWRERVQRAPVVAVRAVRTYPRVARPLRG